jgi:hypothetical protein
VLGIKNLMCVCGWILLCIVKYYYIDEEKEAEKNKNKKNEKYGFIIIHIFFSSIM